MFVGVSGLLATRGFSRHKCSEMNTAVSKEEVVRNRGVHVAQSCLTPWGPVGRSPARLLCHGILQARILEWVAISFSRGSSQPRD